MKRCPFFPIRVSVMILAILPLAGKAASTYECPPERYGRVGHIDYSTADYFATFTLEGYPDERMALSHSQNLTTPRGRLMTAMVMAAYTAGVKVDLGYCEEGRVDRIVIEDRR